MMRTLVKTTPFDPPNLSSAMGLAPSSLARASSMATVPPHALRPDMFRGEARAFLWLLDRRPMATSRQRLELSALDPLRKPLRRARRRDRIVFAGHEERRAVDEAGGPRPSPTPKPRRIRRNPPGPGAGGSRARKLRRPDCRPWSTTKDRPRRQDRRWRSCRSAAQAPPGPATVRAQRRRARRSGRTG